MQNENIYSVEFILNKLKKHLDLNTYRELASFLGVKEGTLNAWKARNSIGDIDTILTKCKGVSYEWLKTGVGEMYRGEGDLKERGLHGGQTLGLSKLTAPDAQFVQHSFDDEKNNNRFKDVFSVERDLVRLLKYYLDSRNVFPLTAAKTLHLTYPSLKKILAGSAQLESYTEKLVIDLLIQEHVLAEDGTIADPGAFQALEVSQCDVRTLIDKNGLYTQNEYVYTPCTEIRTKDGGAVHSEQIVDSLAFKVGWLKASLGVEPCNVGVISVVGDAMEPYLTEGDVVVVDFSVASIENNALYVLQFGDSLVVKRIQVKLNGEIVVKSDNPLYDQESISGESTGQLNVVGRVVRRLVR